VFADARKPQLKNWPEHEQKRGDRNQKALYIARRTAGYSLETENKNRKEEPS
jgi:hypothetical protein